MSKLWRIEYKIEDRMYHRYVVAEGPIEAVNKLLSTAGHKPAITKVEYSGKALV